MADTLDIKGFSNGAFSQELIKYIMMSIFLWILFAPSGIIMMTYKPVKNGRNRWGHVGTFSEKPRIISHSVCV